MSLRSGVGRRDGTVPIWAGCALAVLLGLSAVSFGQAAPAKAAKTGYYVDTTPLHLVNVLPPPPVADSPENVEEMATLHRIESSRTPAQVATARADEAEEDIFIFRTVLGEAFRADQLPLTAALSDHVHSERDAAAADLKPAFARARPYQTDKTLRPVCALTEAHNSYPSGHTLSGYLLAFTLAEMVPEKKEAILARADDYAHNRLVCGVHHPSDLEASHRVAYAVFGAMMLTPKFTQDMEAARKEVVTRLGAK
jgi:acid phosphatase (class A)